MNGKRTKKIAVIGAGHMGHGIAEVALLSGYSVYLCDLNDEILEEAKSLINWSLNKFVEKSSISKNEYMMCMKNLTLTVDLEAAAKATDLCIEAVPEKLNLKKEIFKKLDRFSPQNTILASNTSTMSITKIGEVTKRPDKIIGLHFPTPPPLAKVIEIVRGKKTSEKTMEFAIDFVKKTKKEYIISKDSPGFICNRIMAPSMLLIQLIFDREEYLPAQIDAAALNQGIIMGPFELMDYLGLDIIFDSSNYLAEHLSEDYDLVPRLKKLVQEKKLGRKTGEGIYKWGSDGKRPNIDLSNPADFDLMLLMKVQVNEAVKVFEEKIASIQDINTGMKLHYHNPLGPFELIKSMDLKDLTRSLDKLADRYDKEVFRAHKWIRDGSIKTRLKQEK